MPGGWPPGQRMTGRGDTRGTVPNIDKKIEPPRSQNMGSTTRYVGYKSL